LEAEPSPAPSLEETFRSERGKLLRYLGRRAGHDAAPDLVQEVFARAASSNQAARLINPAAFVKRIARNLLIDRARSRASNNVVLFPLDEERDISVPPEQGLAIEAQDLLRIYKQAVERLPDKTRRVFLMSRTDNLSHREISEEIGISVATVEYHIMRAIAIVATAVEAGR
jgi:RNA polymerase sigma factor (sigma-70 family)